MSESDVDLTAFLHNSAELAGMQAAHKGVRLDITVQDGLPNLYCDERILMQIVNNLLSNAVKFSHEGSHVLIAARRGRNGSVDIEFADQGIGMTARDIDEVLKPFSRADSPKAREYEGTGLGLPICQKFMELHGGTLSIESELGKGTTVTICFPAARARPLSAASSGTPNQGV